MDKKDIGKLNRDELVKSLEDLDFSPEEIDDIVLKAEKEDKFQPKDEAKKEDDTTVDEEAAENAEGKEKEEMQKSCGKIIEMKKEIDKSMSDFLEKYGSAPGIKPSTQDLEKIKAEEDELNKSEVNGFEKAFGGRFDSIEKGLSEQMKINEEFMKSLQGINQTVQMIAETPNPFKGVFGNYKGNILEKGEKLNDAGKRVLSISQNKEACLDEFQKAVDKIENEDDKQIVRNMIGSLNISNIVSPAGINIVKKALDIDIIK